jgi:hypothetical protein
VGLLGLAAIVNSSIYFRELQSYDDRLQMRELLDIVAQNVAPGRTVFMTMIEDRPDFLRSNHEWSQFTARGVVGVDKEPELLRQVPYVRLFPSVLALRDRDMEARVVYESRFEIGPQPREILSFVVNCFPGTTIQEFKFTTMYTIPKEAIAASRCALDTRS